MQVENLIQGSDAWHQFRLNHFGASEAAAMLGLSPKVKRNELLAMKHSGNAKEFSDWVQVNILDHGHAVEALARPLIEGVIGDDLYPVTHEADLLPPWCEFHLSASLDGLTMMETVAFEHKQWNAALAAAVAAGELPDEFMPQCQQILMVVEGCEKVVFTVSDGTPERLVHMDVLPDADWQERIRAGWTQFAIDLAEYQHVEVLPAAVATPRAELPALTIQVSGALALNSNLTVWGKQLTEFIDNINLTPCDDQGFADAEDAVKKLERAEANLAAAEASALGQTASIDEMCRTVAMYKKLARDTRLMMEKLVKARKETVRVEIQQEAKDKKAAHITALNARLGKPYMPEIAADFAGVMKGKKTVASLRDAADTELARFKIEANAIADKIQINLTTLRELAPAHAFLFADTPTIVLKAADDLTALVKMRISDHDLAEVKKAEELRAKIAEEERIKAEKAAAETIRLAQAESDRLAAEASEAERERAAADTQRQLAKQASQIAAERTAEPVAQVATPKPTAPIASRRAPAAAAPVPAPIRPAPAPELLDAAADDLYPSDRDILDVMFDQFGLTAAEAIERLAKFDFAAEYAVLIAEAA